MGAAMDRNTLGPSPGAERAPDHRVEISQAPDRRKVAVDGEDVAWYYPAVYDEVAPIAGYVAFYPRRTEIEEM